MTQKTCPFHPNSNAAADWWASERSAAVEAALLADPSMTMAERLDMHEEFDVAERLARRALLAS